MWNNGSYTSLLCRLVLQSLRHPRHWALLIRQGAAMETHLSRFLRDYRSRHHLKQTVMEGKLEITTKGYISKLESGVIESPGEEVLQKIAALTGTDQIE